MITEQPQTEGLGSKLKAMFGDNGAEQGAKIKLKINGQDINPGENGAAKAKIGQMIDEAGKAGKINVNGQEVLKTIDGKPNPDFNLTVNALKLIQQGKVTDFQQARFQAEREAGQAGKKMAGSKSQANDQGQGKAGRGQGRQMNDDGERGSKSRGNRGQDSRDNGDREPGGQGRVRNAPQDHRVSESKGGARVGT